METEPLAQLLQGFVADWNRQRPSADQRAGRRFARPDSGESVALVGAVAWLSQETRLPEETISTVARARNRTTELYIADALVAALGRPEVFHDGTLEIRPNPLAPRAARASCCGGSLTGVA